MTKGGALNRQGKSGEHLSHPEAARFDRGNRRWREFGWPLAARAQQPGRAVPRILTCADEVIE